MNNRSNIINIILITLCISLMLIFVGCKTNSIRSTDQIEHISKSQLENEKKDSLTNINDLVEVDVEPYIDYNQLSLNLKYPKDARENSIEGRVVIRVLVDIDGKIKKFLIEESSNDIFINSAINAIKKTKFLPAYSKGKPIMCWISIPIQYRL